MKKDLHHTDTGLLYTYIDITYADDWLSANSSVLTCSSLIKLRSIWIYLQGNKIDDNAGIVEIF